MSKAQGPTPAQDEPPRDPAPRQPAGRGEHARRRVLRAALEVLAESGLPGFNMESVARRAGAGKATLYRHWASPSRLLVDAMDAEFRPSPSPNTGVLRDDLVQVLTQFTAALNHSPFPKLMAAFIDASERDPGLRSMHDELTGRRRQPILDALATATERGEIATDLDLELLCDLLAGPFFYRRFVAHRPIPGGMPAAVVDQVLASLKPIPARPRRRRMNERTRAES